MNKFIFILAIFFLSIIVCQAQITGIDFQSEDWKEASALARKENKLIFIDGYTTWCAPCKIMEEHVFTHKSCGDLYNSNFINLRMDMEKNEGPLFVARYGVGIYPIFLYLAWDGTLILKMEGYRNIEDVVSDGKRALEPYRFERALEDRFNGGDRMPDFLYHYTYYKKARNDENYKDIIPLYLESQSDWSNEHSVSYIFDFVTAFNSDMFRFMASNKELFQNVVGKPAFNQKFDHFVNNALDNNGLPLSLEDREAIISTAYPESATRKNMEYRLQHYKTNGPESDYANTLYNYITTYTPDDTEIIRSNLPLFKKHLTTVDQRHQILSWVAEDAEEKNTAIALMSYAKYLLSNDQPDLALLTAKKAVKQSKSDGGDTKSMKMTYKQIKATIKAQKKA
jgi:thiol-disulfide isomerase/thioredoxin